MTPDDVISFWLGAESDPPFSKAPQWWRKDPELDAEIRTKFGPLHESIAAGDHEDWRREPRSLAAYVIVLDQFSRNLFRDDPRAFAFDGVAQLAVLEAMASGMDRQASLVQRVFLYMPLMHAEDRLLQDRSVIAFATLAAEAPEELRAKLNDNTRFAVLHRNIVERFGRYPHRNAVLGRKSTAAEIAFLKEPGSSF